MATDVFAPPATLSNEEILRYSRHLIMPEVAMEGQLKLKQAKVLLIGAGGLGADELSELAALLTRPASARSAWWISMSWTTRTCSVR